MGGFFSKQKHHNATHGNQGKEKKPQPPKAITEQERAVLDLKNQRDKLHKYSKQLEINITKEKEMAKKALANGNKNTALLMLKKKRYQESLLDKAEKQYSNLDEMVNSLEFASIQRDVFERLKQGKDVLEALNKEIDIDEVDKIMQDTQEGIAFQKEVSEMLSGQLSSEEEADVMAELEALTAEEETVEAPQVTIREQETIPKKEETVTDKEETVTEKEEPVTEKEEIVTEKEETVAEKKETVAEKEVEHKEVLTAEDMAELDALEDEVEAVSGKVPDMPSVPTKPLPEVVTTEQEEKPQLVPA